MTMDIANIALNNSTIAIFRKEDPAWALPLGEADRRVALTELTAFVQASK